MNQRMMGPNIMAITCEMETPREGACGQTWKRLTLAAAFITRQPATAIENRPTNLSLSDITERLRRRMCGGARPADSLTLEPGLRPWCGLCPNSPRPRSDSKTDR